MQHSGFNKPRPSQQISHNATVVNNLVVVVLKRHAFDQIHCMQAPAALFADKRSAVPKSSHVLFPLVKVDGHCKQL